ncbi:MAG: hypothetical protein RQ966_03390, partial [Acetobacteraceae bacterium]|nr:hypothetical protein [Acetobacteraceae bacterium]
MKILQNAMCQAVGAAFVASLLAGTAMAQLPKEAPKTSGPGLTVPNERGSALYDRPKGNTLAPVDSPPLPTAAAEMPTDKLKVPAGFKVEPYATGIADARSLAVTPSGIVFVGNRLLDKVYAVTPGANGGKPTVKVIASGLYRPNGVAFHDGALYVAELNRITRYDNIEANLDHPPKPV